MLLFPHNSVILDSVGLVLGIILSTSRARSFGFGFV